MCFNTQVQPFVNCHKIHLLIFMLSQVRTFFAKYNTVVVSFEFLVFLIHREYLNVF